MGTQSIFFEQNNYMEAILSNSTQKLLRPEITKMLTAFKKNTFIVTFIIILGTLSLPIVEMILSRI